MKKITVNDFLEGVNSIYVEQPTYRLGGDGSDGTCDCIGLPRGASKRKGVEGIKNFSGTNMAARKTIENLEAVSSAKSLSRGEVVLKTRDADDPSYPLPDRYRKGHADYNSKWGETNFTHIGVVTRTDPLEITHMTSPTAKKDTKLGNWKYHGTLPWVDYGSQPGPGPEPVPVTEWAKVIAESGSSVKMRAKPTTDCRLYWDVPIGSQVMIDEIGDAWCKITWAGQTGYMMTKFLLLEGKDETKIPTYSIIITGLDWTQANALLNNYPGSIVTEE
jgi:hypothetical protein